MEGPNASSIVPAGQTAALILATILSSQPLPVQQSRNWTDHGDAFVWNHRRARTNLVYTVHSRAQRCMPVKNYRANGTTIQPILSSPCLFRGMANDVRAWILETVRGYSCTTLTPATSSISFTMLV